MKRPLSSTAPTAASISALMLRYCALRSTSGMMGSAIGWLMTISERPDDPSRVADRQGARRNVPDHHRRSTDHSVVTDRHAGEDHDPIAEPDPVPDHHGSRRRHPGSLLYVVKIVVQDSDVSAQKAVRADLHQLGGGNVGAVVEECPVTDLDPSTGKHSQHGAGIV